MLALLQLVMEWGVSLLTPLADDVGRPWNLNLVDVVSLRLLGLGGLGGRQCQLGLVGHPPTQGSVGVVGVDGPFWVISADLLQDLQRPPQ